MERTARSRSSSLPAWKASSSPEQADNCAIAFAAIFSGKQWV